MDVGLTALAVGVYTCLVGRRRVNIQAKRSPFAFLQIRIHSAATVQDELKPSIEKIWNENNPFSEIRRKRPTPELRT